MTDYIEQLAEASGQDFRMLDPLNYIKLAKTDRFLFRHNLEARCWQEVTLRNTASYIGREY